MPGASSECGAFGPRFAFWLILLLLPACAGMQSQDPSVELQRVHPSGAQRIAFSPSGALLASGGIRGDLRIWTMPDGSLEQVLPRQPSSIRGLAWLDEGHLFSVDKRGNLVTWDLHRERPVATARLGAVQNMVISADRRWLLVAQGERLLRLDTGDLEALAVTDMRARVLSVAVDPDGARIAASLSDGSVWLLDSGLNQRSQLPPADDDTQDVRFSPDGRYLYGGSWFHLLVWDLESRQLEQRSTEHLGKLISLDPSPDGHQLLTIGRITDSSVRIVDAQSNQVIRRYRQHALCGWQARFSPDGRFAATSSEDGSIHIYNLEEAYKPEVRYQDEY